MHLSNTVVFVSAGMNSPKKRDHLLARRQLYLNYGVLSLATMLDLSGTETAVYHGEHRSPNAVSDELFESGVLPSNFPLMVSIPSFYALEWASEFCELVKNRDSAIRIVIGGRWVVGPDPGWLRTKIPHADIFVPGLGEPILSSLLTSAPDIRRLPAPTPNFNLNHRLVKDYLRYQPSIETSRGCGMGCAFCEERDIPLEKLRSPELIANALADTAAQYDLTEIRPYFQASMFSPSSSWATKFQSEVHNRGLSIAWRTETRVDALTPKAIALLAQAGLKVLDLGLETASPTQIIAMHKSNDPDRYLDRASSLLAACHDHGVLAKVNVLLYAGETCKTFAETQAWLDNHAAAIAGVSVGPVIAYGPPKTSNFLLEDWALRGATPVDPDSAVKTGITSVHLSPDFDASSAEAASLELSRRYMDIDGYFRLKSFSYYARDYTRAQFDLDVAMSDSDRLPFRLPPS